MWEYLKAHEAFIVRSLADPNGIALADLAALHDRQLRYMQHERLIHLLVTLSIALMWLLSIGFVATQESWAGLAVCTLLLVLLVAYVIHYYRLENGVQRWYHLANAIDRAAGRISPACERPGRRSEP